MQLYQFIGVSPLGCNMQVSEDTKSTDAMVISKSPYLWAKYRPDLLESWRVARNAFQLQHFDYRLSPALVNSNDAAVIMSFVPLPMSYRL